MIEAAGATGPDSEDAVSKDVLVSVERAGADLILGHFARNFGPHLLDVPRVHPGFWHHSCGESRLGAVVWA